MILSIAYAGVSVCGEMWRVERAGQLVGEALLFCYLFALITEGCLAFHFTPGAGEVVYDGSYEPLRGVPMSEAYSSTLKISYDVEGGLLMRELHHQALFVLVLGVVIWAVLARHRYALIALGLVLLGGVTGYASVDDTLSEFVRGTVWVYVLHMVVAVGLAVVLVLASRWEAARRPRTLGLVVTAFCAALLMTYLV